ncbi:MAG: hypothetical protein L0Y60_14540 [Beijerinckiaceae bacterium]|nr:hypothetical protein [Beijerinckiaceae bacterium]
MRDDIQLALTRGMTLMREKSSRHYGQMPSETRYIWFASLLASGRKNPKPSPGWGLRPVRGDC